MTERKRVGRHRVVPPWEPPPWAAPDPVDEDGVASFPASDPPSHWCGGPSVPRRPSPAAPARGRPPAPGRPPAA